MHVFRRCFPPSRYDRSQQHEETRAAAPKRLVTNLAHDLRYAFRTYRKNPGFVAVVVLTLTIGIGVNVGFFTAINAILLAPVPVRDPARLAIIQLWGTRNGKAAEISYSEYLALREIGAPFQDLTAFQSVSLDASYGTAHGVLVSDNFFHVLRANMAFGRAFAPEEQKVPGAHPVVILSHKAWKRHLEGDPQIVGKTIGLKGGVFTVIGVAEPGFGGPALGIPDFWAPAVMHASLLPGSAAEDGATALAVTLAGRLPRGVRAQQLRSQILAAAKNISEPGRLFKECLVLPQGRFDRLKVAGSAPVTMIGLPLMLVLLIACANVASLLLARAGARRREIGVRLSLGATRARLMQQLLTENGILALASGIFGVLFGRGLAIALISRSSSPAWGRLIPRGNWDVHLDLNVVLFTLLLSLGAAFFSGFTPAIEATRTDLVSAMRGEARSFFGRLKAARARDRLVLVQISVCLVLLIGAGLSLPSAFRALRVRGFNSDNVFSLVVDPGPSGREDPNARLLLAERLRHVPSVTHMAVIPQSSITYRQYARIGTLSVHYRYVTSQYFNTLQIPIVRGRPFTEEEAREEAAVVIIDQAAAAALFPGQEPIGKTIPIRASTAPPEPGWGRSPGKGLSEVIGVAGDVIYIASRTDLACVYLPTRPDYAGKASTLIRIAGASPSVLDAIRAEFSGIGGEARLRITPLSDDLYADSLPLTFVTAVITSLGAIALMLTLVGLYAMMSYVVGQRTQEIGIRMAMGAQPRAVLWLILARGLKLTIIGIVVGLPLSAGVYRVVGSLVFRTNLLEPAVFAVVAVLLAIVCLVAAYIPARRATRLDPLIALRHE